MNSILCSVFSYYSALFLTTLGFALVALAPISAVEPPPGGGYPEQNTALGEDALFSLAPAGDSNTAIGFQALYNDTDGSNNTAVGSNALHNNITGGANVGVGHQALDANTTGTDNVAIGLNAMVANTTGGLNVGVGNTALQAHSDGFGNTAIGWGAMSLGYTGGYNTAIGHVAMTFSSGSNNTAVGDGAMNSSSGNSNVAVGRSAGLNFAGDNNIAIGEYAGQNVMRGANNIEIGNEGAPKDDSIIRLGTVGVQKKTFVAGISSATVSNGVAVMVNGKGQLGIATSSARSKEAIKPMKDASEAILSLEPVTFHYKRELDPEAIPQFGLVAEEVAKIDPDLVARDDQGKPSTVRYEAVNAMLLNEFLKEHRKVEEQGTALKSQAGKIERLEETVTKLQSALEKQGSHLQPMSDRVESAPPQPR